MHRFHLPDAQPTAAVLTLTGTEATHATRVLRVKPGDAVTVLNGSGIRFLTRVEQVTRDSVLLHVRQVEPVPPPPVRITLFQAVTKPKSMDSIVEKATELGVHAIQPILTEHVVTRLSEAEGARKAVKWERTAIEALKQCGGGWLPSIRPVKRISSLLEPSKLDGFHFLASLAPVSRPLRDCLSPASVRKAVMSAGTVGLWVGPEGDFTREETNHLTRLGAIPVTLGQQVLRSETAAVCLVALVTHEIAWLARTTSNTIS